METLEYRQLPWETEESLQSAHTLHCDALTFERFPSLVKGFNNQWELDDSQTDCQLCLRVRSSIADFCHSHLVCS